MSGIPDDFEAFWHRTVAEAFAAPLDYHRNPADEKVRESHVVEVLHFRGIQGETLHGWLAYPAGARRLPGFVWIPPYGRESKLPDDYGTREGFTSLSFNFFGESAFHQEKYVPSRGYFAQGADLPETWIFRQMFQNSVIASRVLQAQIEVDEDRIGVMGMSQGAGITLWNAAWNPIARAACADMPFLGKVPSTLVGNVYRYPLKELTDYMAELPMGEARILNTVSYFDTATHAAFSKIPTHVSLGLKDPACKPDSVRAIFEALPEPKALSVLDWGHDWHPDMISQNAAWLREHLK